MVRGVIQLSQVYRECRALAAPCPIQLQDPAGNENQPHQILIIDIERAGKALYVNIIGGLYSALILQCFSVIDSEGLLAITFAVIVHFQISKW